MSKNGAQIHSGRMEIYQDKNLCVEWKLNLTLLSILRPSVYDIIIYYIYNFLV